MKQLGRFTAICLAGGMVLTCMPLSAQASAVSGVSGKLSQCVIADDTVRYAGLSSIVADYLDDNSAKIDENKVEEVSKEKESEKTEQKLVDKDIANLCVAKVNDYVNVRAKATTKSKVKGKLYNKNVATVLTKEGDWYKVESGNLKGYIKADYVVVGNKDALESAGTRYAKVKADALRVRKKATKKAGILGVVPKNEEILVIDEKDDWVKVSIAEGKGWVSDDYVKIHTEYTYGETRAEERARNREERTNRRRAGRAARRATATSTGGSSSSEESSGGSSDYEAPTGSNGQAVANYALQFVGNPYRWGGTSLTNGCDCSGFVLAVYSRFGVSLPHSSTAMRGVGYGVSSDSMAAGDIVCYSGHVGIYIGGGQIVNALNHNAGITITNAHYSGIITVRRIF